MRLRSFRLPVGFGNKWGMVSSTLLTFILLILLNLMFSLKLRLRDILTRSSAIAVIADCTAYGITTWNSRGRHEYLQITKVCFCFLADCWFCG